MVKRSTHRFPAVLLGLFLCLSAMPVAAEWVQGQGHGVIMQGDSSRAEQQARDAALRNAALQYESRFSSEETVTNGVVTDTRMTLISNARVQEIRNEHIHRQGNRIRVTLEARFSREGEEDESAQCGGDGPNAYTKRVAFAGFRVVNADQGAIGRLQGLDRAVPEALIERLLDAPRLSPYAATHLTFYHDDARNAPTQMEARNRLHQALTIAEELNVQFIVSGVVRDLGVERPDTWRLSTINNLRRGLGLLNRDRRFVVDLFIHDGFSGAPLLQQRFSTSGLWNRGPGDRVGFATADFDRTPYGEQVNRLLTEMAAQVESQLACQPFMARVERVDDHQVRIGAGASSGVRPGDKLRLYRAERFLSLPNQQPELQNSHVSVTIRQVHPDFASGEMAVEGGRVNIRKGDRVIGW
ncbi:MAG: flagellar assembly protein T N-terminal domain-containing protein [Oleiphilaceae bacterium]|nr:flagellar assembly protein T N-terminal domain-containing protein [Oleiphilaceae bacterium]